MSLSFIFGCAHKRHSFPQTPVRKGRFRQQTYVCCLDCGKEFAYHWREMRVGAELRKAEGPRELREVRSA